MLLVCKQGAACEVLVCKQGAACEVLVCKQGVTCYNYNSLVGTCRFWDFDRDENYALDLSSIVTSDGKPASVTCLHSDPNQG